VGGVAEQFEDHRHGRLVDPSSPQDLADAIAQLATDAGMRKRMSAAARALAEHRYATPDMVARTLAWYAQAHAAFSQSQEGTAS
ncbi:MAG: glycosyltransferase, partial [Planctomycetota bacterium]